MKRIFVLLLVVVFGVSAAFANEISVEKIGGKKAREIGFMTLSAAAKEFSGYTFAYTSYHGKGGRGRYVMGFTGNAVGYFSPNGNVYIWRSKADKMKVGDWWVSEPVLSQKEPGENLLCFDFKDNNEQGKCAIIKRLDDELFERTKGNIFSLRSGKVPKVVKSHPRKLQSVMNDLNKK